jgi:plasmid maintenance system antidote protein VapI
MPTPRPLHRKNGLLLSEMIRQGYTLQSLARAIGVHYLTVWRIVNQQHRPTRLTAERLCALLQKTPRELGFEVWGKGGEAGDG